jgi:hypothetical protein
MPKQRAQVEQLQVANRLLEELSRQLPHLWARRHPELSFLHAGTRLRQP